MPYLLAIFLPPVYFATRKRWGMFVFSSICLLLSLGLYLSIVFVPLGLVLWGLFSILATWDLRKILQREQAEEIARAMHERAPN